MNSNGELISGGVKRVVPYMADVSIDRAFAYAAEKHMLDLAGGMCMNGDGCSLRRCVEGKKG